jgi:succinate dehydrogenase/fumarate reductase flavoprotein subunit
MIFGLMLAHEGKCRVPIYQNLTRWGYDPDKDMLQYPVQDYSRFPIDTSWCGPENTPDNWRGGGGGYLVDWRLQTSLPGLFAAGCGPIFGHGCHGESHTSGRYSGRQAALYASQNEAIEPDDEQVRRERERCYAPIKAGGDIGWKELNYAIAKIMQDYCGDYKTEHTLDMGIRRMKDLMETEGERMYASNPHELVRAIESRSLCELGIAYMEAAKARRGSVKGLGFFRNDYPEYDESQKKLIPISLKDDKVHTRDLSLYYHLEAPYSSDLEENYQKYAAI